MKQEIQGEISDLLKRSSAVRALLLSRRQELQAEMEEIDAQLKLIPSIGLEPSAGEKIGPHNEHTVQLTIPALVKNILKRNPVGIRSSDIVKQVNRVRPLKDTRIHSVIFKLGRSGHIEHRGQRPNVLYFLTEKGLASMSP
jgi:hypothetical protein